MAKLRKNPQDNWKIEDLKKIAIDYGVTFRQPGTSHVTFTKVGTGFRLIVPSNKPIKTYYIKQFVELLSKIEKEVDQSKQFGKMLKAEGEQIGLEKGEQIGLEKGKTEEKEEVAKKML